MSSTEQLSIASTAEEVFPLTRTKAIKKPRCTEAEKMTLLENRLTSPLQETPTEKGKLKRLKPTTLSSAVPVTVSTSEVTPIIHASPLMKSSDLPMMVTGTVTSTGADLEKTNASLMQIQSILPLEENPQENISVSCGSALMRKIERRMSAKACHPTQDSSHQVPLQQEFERMSSMSSTSSQSTEKASEMSSISSLTSTMSSLSSLSGISKVVDNKYKSRYWVFTLNNYSREDMERLNPTQDIDIQSFVEGIVWQEEIGESGTPHLQGYVEFLQRRSIPQIKKYGGPWSRMHLEGRLGSALEAFDYCTKPRSEGGLIKDGIQCIYGLDRNALEKKCPKKKTKAKSKKEERVAQEKQMMEIIGSCETKIEALKTLNKAGFETKAAAMWVKMVWDAQEEVKASECEEHILKTLLPWQQNLEREILAPTHGEYIKQGLSPPKGLDRKIIWVVDLVGGVGKSTFADHATAAYPRCVKLENSKSADIARFLKKPRIVFFDFTKTMGEFVNYGVIESVKNGSIFSPKYDSTMKKFGRPHVIVLANFYPEREKFSRERPISIRVLRRDIDPNTGEEITTETEEIMRADDGMTFEVGTPAAEAALASNLRRLTPEEAIEIRRRNALERDELRHPRRNFNMHTDV